MKARFPSEAHLREHRYWLGWYAPGLAWGIFVLSIGLVAVALAPQFAALRTLSLPEGVPVPELSPGWVSMQNINPTSPQN